MPMPKGYMLYDVDPGWLKQKYEVEGLSTTDIAGLCDYSTRHISRLLDKHGIKKRSRSEGVKAEKSREKRSRSMTGKLAGEKNPRYKGGYVSNGYMMIGSKRYSHIVAEKKYGRELRAGEVVHHINGDTLDNRPENLQVMTISEHVATHQVCGGYRKGMKPWNYKGGKKK